MGRFDVERTILFGGREIARTVVVQQREENGKIQVAAVRGFGAMT